MSGMPLTLICKYNAFTCSKSPECYICSYRKVDTPLAYKPTYHLHYSSRETRVMAGVEWSTSNRSYMCPTCQHRHPAWPAYGLNVCLADSQLHELHNPRGGAVWTPDTIHIDWNTIPGATIPTLQHAWQVDYSRSKTPMRVLLVAGINDLLKGGNMTSITNSILNLKQVIDYQNQFHPSMLNELVVGTILNPPKLCWFPDTGPPPHGHINRLEEITAINQWIVEFNQGYGNYTPRFHRFGVKSGRKFVNGASVPFHAHQLRRWRQSEAVHDMIHLNDFWRIRLGLAVVHHFESQRFWDSLLV